MKFFTALGLAFIILKLCGVIAWSWWLVLLPLYWGFAVLGFLVIGFFATIFGFAGIATAVDKVRGWFKKKSK